MGKELGAAGLDGSLSWQTTLWWSLSSSMRLSQLMFLWQFCPCSASSLALSPQHWSAYVVQEAKAAQTHCYNGADLALCQFSLPNRVLFGVRGLPAQGRWWECGRAPSTWISLIYSSSSGLGGNRVVSNRRMAFVFYSRTWHKYLDEVDSLGLKLCWSLHVQTIFWSRIAAWSKERVPCAGSLLREEVTVDKQPFSYFLAHSVNLQLQMTVNLWLFLGQQLGVPAVKVKSFIKV